MEIKTLNSIKVLWIQPRFTYTDHTNEDILSMCWVRLADSSFVWCQIQMRMSVPHFFIGWVSQRGYICIIDTFFAVVYLYDHKHN